MAFRPSLGIEAIRKSVTLVIEEVTGAIGRMGTDEAAGDAIVEEIERGDDELRWKNRYKRLNGSSDK